MAVSLLSLVVSASAPAADDAPQITPGALLAGGDQTRFTLRARAVPAERLELNVRAQTGLTIVAPPTALVTVEFADLPAREGAARIGAALGGLVPLRASWAETAPDARHPRAETYFLVRPGTRRQQLLDAYALQQQGVAHQRLFELLTGDGAAVLADAVTQARDATRGQPERLVTIKLIGSLGVPEAVPALLAILREGPGTRERQSAAFALGWTGRAETAPALRATLADPDVGVALAAAWSLVRLGDTTGVPLALAHLRDAHTISALFVVAATGDPAHLPALEAALAGAKGFARLRLRTTIADLAMARLDEGGRIEACGRLLADADAEVRLHGATTLAKIGSAAAERALQRVATDRSHDGAEAAVMGLASLRRSRLPQPDVVFE